MTTSVAGGALLGISGVRRNACAAVCLDGHIEAVCEQERLTRVRGVGLHPGGLPAEAVDQVLSLAKRRRADVSAFVLAERGVSLPGALPTATLDHHLAHAATAYLTSPHERAAVLVCDTNHERQLSVWRGDARTLTDTKWHWRGPGFAALYSECATLFACNGASSERLLEATAHLGDGSAVERLHATFKYGDGGLRLSPGWRTLLRQMIDDERCTRGQPLVAASSVQRRIGELLLELVAEIRVALDADTLCLGGGLFFNTYFTTLIRQSGLYRHVFVPVNPGNAGVAVGAALLLSEHCGAPGQPHTATSPFLGPEYDADAVKETLDGCKLSYSYVRESEALDMTVAALTRGQLVGWFDGRMEWGPRALGHRSILADPRSPYVLDNLNGYLRKRERWRAFGVSVREEQVQDGLCGPAASPFMEYEYRLRDDRLRPVIPPGATSIRVQTVSASDGPFWELHRRMEQATGTGVLVNTSFNGFHEPIACTPRDAVRVFYGTGLDMLVMGRFILRK